MHFAQPLFVDKENETVPIKQQQPLTPNNIRKPCSTINPNTRTPIGVKVKPQSILFSPNPASKVEKTHIDRFFEQSENRAPITSQNVASDDESFTVIVSNEQNVEEFSDAEEGSQFIQLTQQIRDLNVRLLNEQEDKKQYKEEYERIQNQTRTLQMAYAYKSERLKFYEEKLQQQDLIVHKQAESLRQLQEAASNKVGREEWEEQRDLMEESLREFEIAFVEQKKSEMKLQDQITLLTERETQQQQLHQKEIEDIRKHYETILEELKRETEDVITRFEQIIVELQDSQKKNAEYTNQISKLEETIVNLKNQLNTTVQPSIHEKEEVSQAHFQKDLEKMKADYHRLKQDYDELNDFAREEQNVRDETIAELEEKIQEITAELETVRSNETVLQNNHQQELESAQNELTNKYSVQLEELERETIALKEQLESNQQEILQLNQTLEESKQQYSELVDTLSGKESELHDVIEKHQAEVNDITNQFNSELARTKEELEHQFELVKDLQSKEIETLQQSLQSNQEQLSSAALQFQEFKTMHGEMVRDAQTKENQLNLQLNQLEAELAHERECIQQLQIHSKEREMDYQLQLSDIKAKYENIQHLYQESLLELESIRGSLFDSENQCQTLQNTILEFKNKNGQLEDLAQTQSEAHQTVLNKLQEYSQEIQTLKDRIQELAISESTARAKLESNLESAKINGKGQEILNERMNKMAIQNSKLKTELARQTAAMEDLNTQLNNTMIELERMRSLEEEMTTLEETVVQQENEIEEQKNIYQKELLRMESALHISECNTKQLMIQLEVLLNTSDYCALKKYLH